MIVRHAPALLFLISTLVISSVFTVEANSGVQPSTKRCGFLASHSETSPDNFVDGFVQATRPSLPNWIESSSGRFRLHFATSGVDAIPTADEDANGVADFLDVAMATLEMAWQTYIDIGYTAPPSDGEAGGSAAIDVYVHDLSKAGGGGTGLYGNTSPEQRISSGPPERFTTWVELDNDYASTDRNQNGNPVYATTGADGLRITAVHELHHVFQAGSYGVNFTQAMMYEFTSTWMEQRFFPEIPDWVTYASNIFAMPAAFPFSGKTGMTGYVWAFFNRFVSGTNDAILLDTWQFIGANKTPFQALVDACNNQGAPLSTAFCDNLAMFYRTGTRDRDNDSLMFGSLLPEILLSANITASAPSELLAGSLAAFEVRAYRLSIPTNGNESVNTGIIVTWPNEEALIRGSENERRTFSIVATAMPHENDISIPGTTWGLRVEPSDVCVWVDGSLNQRIQSPYPHPVKLGVSRHVYVPVPTANYLDIVEVTILTPSFTAIQAESVTVSLDNNRLVAPIILDSVIAPGVYIVQCKHGDSTWLTKLVVQQ